jgi:hypothetical protein
MPPRTRDEIGVTRAPLEYVPLPAGLRVPTAEVIGQEVCTDLDRPLDVDLTGQEFVLFRAIEGISEIRTLAARYGALGLGTAVDDLQMAKGNFPLWPLCLSHDRSAYSHFGPEPLTDWIKQSGLLAIGFGLLGMLRLPPSRRGFLWLRRRTRRIPDHFDLLIDASQHGDDKWWPGLSLLDGVRRAGLRGPIVWPPRKPRGLHRVAIGPPPHYRGPEWADSGRATIRFDLSRPGIEGALRDLLNPWLGRLRLGLSVEAGTTVPTVRTHVDMVGIVWVQLANALLSQVEPQLCAWERCPGPPERPGIFLWQFGSEARQRNAKYCHPKCKQAAAQAEHRQSPGYRRSKQTKTRESES